MGRKSKTPDEIWTRVGPAIRDCRIRRGIRQNVAAAAAGMTAAQLCNIERGRCSLDLRTLIRLAATLGVTLDDLVSGVADRRTIPAATAAARNSRDRKAAKQMARAAIRFAAMLKDKYNFGDIR